MAYGKIWSSMFTGSLYGSGATELALMAYCVACADIRDRLDLNPKMLAAVLGCEEDAVVKAIKFLSSPDEESRSKKNKGRRIVKEGEYQYYVPNRAKYCMMQSDVDAQKTSRKSTRKYNAKKKCAENGTEFVEADFERYDRSKFPDDWT